MERDGALIVVLLTEIQKPETPLNALRFGCFVNVDQGLGSLAGAEAGLVWTTTPGVSEMSSTAVTLVTK